MMIRPIISMPIEDKETICYYPDINVLAFSYDKEVSADFSDVLFNFFLGIRKLNCISSTKKDPKVIFIEPWRTCNLACTYCYAKAGPQFNKKISYTYLETLVSKYDFNRVLLFGGEPLLDKDFLNNIYALKQWNSFFFSTNGVLINEEIHKKIVSSPNINVQVSIEPPEWSQRINSQGEKQFDLLRSKLKLLAGSKFSFRVVIPPDAPYLDLREFIDRLAHEVGSYNFSISYWPVYGQTLPAWFDKWINESYQIIRTPDYTQCQNKLLGHSLMQYFFEMQNDGFRFFNCNAVYGSVALGPDGRLHGCHENAVVENELDVVSSKQDPLEINNSQRRELAYRWSNNMNKSACHNCTAKYICGGICFVTEQPSASCRFLRQLMPLILAEMIRYKSNETLNLMAKTEAAFEKLYAMKDELKQQVTGKKWKRLVSGELPLHEAVELAEKYYGD
jgi:radical SAM protein with 4Fe4S-binding SPASM domain